MASEIPRSGPGKSKWIRANIPSLDEAIELLKWFDVTGWCKCDEEVCQHHAAMAVEIKPRVRETIAALRAAERQVVAKVNDLRSAQLSAVSRTLERCAALANSHALASYGLADESMAEGKDDPLQRAMGRNCEGLRDAIRALRPEEVLGGE